MHDGRAPKTDYDWDEALVIAGKLAEAFGFEMIDGPTMTAVPPREPDPPIRSVDLRPLGINRIVERHRAAIAGDGLGVAKVYADSPTEAP